MNNHIRIVKVDPKAVTPTRAHDTDIGLDLTAISLHSTVDNGTSNPVFLYDTGLIASPPDGYYLEIVPRSSIIKTGWMLANSVGIIDPTYRGNLLIALVKVHDDTDLISLPFCKTQLVLRKCVSSSNMTVDIVESLDSTERNEGGFGSTDVITNINHQLNYNI